MENVKTSRNLNHAITINNNKKAEITGVVEVISSTDKCVIARTSETMFQITGNNLRVSKLLLEDSICNVEGEIYKLEYNKDLKKKNLFKRLFK